MGGGTADSAAPFENPNPNGGRGGDEEMGGGASDSAAPVENPNPNPNGGTGGGDEEMGGGTVDSATPFENPNPNGGGGVETEKKKVVVVMGATGAGKSRLAIDLASRFPDVEIVNADSMQVYKGLDVLTNKVPLSHRNGVPHHLLGTIDSSVEFTSKDFRDLAVPIIDDILSRDGLPVIVGGTNYYIQALVSPFLVDDLVEDMAACSLNAGQEVVSVDSSDSFERLKEIDPVAANRIHPNDSRKINRYLSLYASFGDLPSNLFKGKAAEKWGRADNFRYDCCFIWVDAALPVLDKYVDERVDCMVEDGLLNEVYDIYNPNADYTRGLRQAIGVREFEEFYKEYFSNTVAGNQCLEENASNHNAESCITSMTNKADVFSRPNFSEILSSDDKKLKILLGEAIQKLKDNTRKLVRRQRRRLNRLKAYFGWELHYIDATEAFSCDDSLDSWLVKVVEPCVDVVNAFLLEELGPLTTTAAPMNVQSQSLVSSRDLWAQHVCEACGNQILRGAHEWEQHKQGRGHRKRVLRLKKRRQSSCLPDQQTASCKQGLTAATLTKITCSPSYVNQSI